MLAADVPARFVVRGTAGSLVKVGIDQQEQRLMAGDRPGHAEWGHDADPLLVFRDGIDCTSVPVPAGDYGQFYVAMRDALREGSRAPVSVAEAVVVMAMVTAAVKSSATGRVVAVADFL
jgi:predicted dehydrogenase